MSLKAKLTESAEDRFMQLLGGKWVLQAISAAAKLGLAEHLSESRSLDELAELTSCHSPSLLRLIRVLVGEALLIENADGRFSLTELGQQLRSGKLRDLAVFVGSPSQWSPWLELSRSLQTGECAFEITHGQSLFSYLDDHPAEGQLYDSAVDAFTRSQALALAQTGLLDECKTVVDVGGGRGTLLMELLTRCQHLRGTLLDRPAVVQSAEPRFEKAGLNGRCSFSGGDFFTSIPIEADCYIIKHVLHNWDDNQATLLLKQCAEALRPGAQVMVVEGVLLPGNMKDATRLMDLEMMVLTGTGRERSKPEFRALFRAAGLKLTQTTPLALGAWLLVAEKSTQ